MNFLINGLNGINLTPLYRGSPGRNDYDDFFEIGANRKWQIEKNEKSIKMPIKWQWDTGLAQIGYYWIEDLAALIFCIDIFPIGVTRKRQKIKN